MKSMTGIPEYVQHWETYDRLYYEKDYDGLINYQKQYVNRHPDMPQEKLMLADAYTYAGRYHLALKILKRLHKFDPYNSEYVQSLVECLMSSGIDPKCYLWRREVIFFERGEETCHWCFEWLAKACVPVDSYDLYMALYSAGYVSFDHDGLIGMLQEDGRFKLKTSHLDGTTVVTRMK